MELLLQMSIKPVTRLIAEFPAEKEGNDEIMGNVLEIDASSG